MNTVTGGFQTIVRLLARTLGPTGAGVLHDTGGGTPEYLDDSATVVRRITALPGRHANSGAAIARELVTGMARRYGDGGASAAVLSGAMLSYAQRVTAAGANPIRVRDGIGLGVAAACQALKTQAEPVTDLAGLATAMTADPELAAVVGEVMSELGPDGAVEIEEQPPSRLDHEYVDGSRWRARPADLQLLTGGHTELTLLDPVVLVADQEFTTADHARAVLEVAHARPGRPPLLVIARDIDGAALRALRINDASGQVINAPVGLATAATRAAEDLDDIAVLTGAEVLAPELGRPVERLVPEQLGRARIAVLERGYLTIGGGAGTTVADRAARLRTRAWELEQAGRSGDRLRLRQARLLGRVACVRVGAPTEPAIEARKLAVRKAVRMLRIALHHGTVPGGGVAYLDCLPAVRAQRAELEGADEAFGVDAVAAALEAPFRRIAANAGLPDAVPPRRPGIGRDVRTGRLVPMREAGITDIGDVCAGALDAAGGVAGLLTCAEVVRGRG